MKNRNINRKDLTKRLFYLGAVSLLCGMLIGCAGKENLIISGESFSVYEVSDRTDETAADDFGRLDPGTWTIQNNSDKNEDQTFDIYIANRQYENMNTGLQQYLAGTIEPGKSETFQLEDSQYLYAVASQTDSTPGTLTLIRTS